MALLVGGDQAVSLGEAGEQLTLAKEVEDEVGCGEPERPLDDHVVDRHEADLGLAVAGVEPQPVVGLDERLVEDLLEGITEHLPGARDMGGDRGRVGDHLVLEASVELHVADLVDQLRRQIAALLLVVLREHQADELGRDPLLGHHQGAEREVEEAAHALLEAGPVRGVATEVDVLRGPVGVLPVEVETLGVLEGEGFGGAHAGMLARMIAEPAWS